MRSGVGRAIETLSLALILLAGVISSTAASVGPQPRQPGAPPLELELAAVNLLGLPASVTITAPDALSPGTLAFEVEGLTDGRRVAAGELTASSTVAISIQPPLDPAGYAIRLPLAYSEAKRFTLRTIPGWVSLLPPLVAILLALLFRQVVPALLAGVWIGAWIVFGGPGVGALRTLDHFVIRALADADRISIVVFSMLLGGMVGVISRSGGTLGLVRALVPYATDSRRGQLVTWFLGIAIFFDDYANTLLVGSTMRPVTDRLKISREKLAYIVDSTAAPVASVALISTWIGYEVSLIDDALRQLGSSLDAYGVFIQSLPYRFYPILALFFGFMVAFSRRDLGPMLKAERRAAAGRLIGERAVPLADFDHEALQAIPDKPRRAANAWIPVLVVLSVTLSGLWFTGRSSLAESGSAQAVGSMVELGLRGVGTVFGAGNSFHALLWGSAAGCLTALGLAWGQRILSLGDGLAAWLGGIKSMTLAIVILSLAWSISGVCEALNTSGFLVATLSSHLDPRWVPALVFVLAALTSFATGTSWGTMGILMPLTVPTAYGVAQAAGLDPASGHQILLGAVSSVLAGSIFGDHCSPISDTTVLSSMASGCDHVDHVRTQLPYALIVAVVGLLICDLPSSFGLSPFVCLGVAGAILAAVLLTLGKVAAPAPGVTATASLNGPQKGPNHT